MFSTRESRETLFRGLRILLGCTAATFAILASFVFTDWIAASFIGIIAGIITTAIWILSVIGLGFLLFALYDDKDYGPFTLTTALAMSVAPVMTLAQAWKSEQLNYGAVILDILMVIGWIYTVVIVVILVFNRPYYIDTWIKSGDSAEEAKLKKQQERETREKTAAAEAARLANINLKNNEPKVIDPRDRTVPKDVAYQQPPGSSEASAA